MSEHQHTYTVGELAKLAGVSYPDGNDSPGAEWLRQVASYHDEATDDDDIAQAADSLVPIYTHNRWQVFVDLAAYNVDLSDFGGQGSGDMTEQAGVALYVVAEQLLRALADDCEHSDDEDEDEDDES